MWANRILSYTLRLLSIELAHHTEPANDRYGNATGDFGACACSVYQALSPPPLERPGYEASIVPVTGIRLETSFLPRPFKRRRRYYRILSVYSP